MILSVISNGRRIVLLTVAWLLASLAAPGCAGTKANKDAGELQTSFASREQAVAAFVTAMRETDRQKLSQILGPEGEELVFSGDAIADEQAAGRFVQAYDKKHQITANEDGSFTLSVGDQDWPMPIPLVLEEATNTWFFDTATGKDEIINRRIGRNELDVIQVCRAIGDAQREYAQIDPNGDGIAEYATKFISDTGKKNGLYWPTAEGEKLSPLGAFVADVEAQGYSISPQVENQPRPYHGYYYRILTSQGPAAPGGAIDYVINGKLIGGYAVVAWPADYGNSGIMTFLADYNGNVYQRDLGEESDKLARTMSAFDPGPDWKKAD